MHYPKRHLDPHDRLVVRRIEPATLSVHAYNATMAHHAHHPNSIPATTSGSRSKLLSTNFKKFISKDAITHPQKALTVQLWNAEQASNNKQKEESENTTAMSSSAGQVTGDIVTSGNSGFPKTGDAPGEHFEPRQTATDESYEPNPSKSIKLSPQRQALVDDVLSTS